MMANITSTGSNTSEVSITSMSEDATMSTAILNDKEYEVQLFGFTPKSFIDGVYNALVDFLNDSVEVTEKYLLNEKLTASQEVTPEFVRQASDRLFSNFLKSFDKSFDRLESYLKKNLFHIPSNVLLPEDEVHHQSYTAGDEETLDLELDNLREEIRNTQYVNCRLRQWMQQAEQTQALLDSYLQQINNYRQVLAKGKISDLSETIVFTADKACNLKEQLTLALHQTLIDPMVAPSIDMPSNIP